MHLNSQRFLSFFLSRFVTDSDCFSAKRSVVKLNCSLTASSLEIKRAFFSLQDRQTMLDRQDIFAYDNSCNSL